MVLVAELAQARGAIDGHAMEAMQCSACLYAHVIHVLVQCIQGVVEVMRRIAQSHVVLDSSSPW